MKPGKKKSKATRRKTSKGRSLEDGRDLRDEEYFISLAFARSGRKRFTQASPILSDVFVHFGTGGEKRLDLLLTPDWSKTPGEVADELKAWLGIEQTDDNGSPVRGTDPGDPQIAFNSGVVAAHLTFEQLICHVLPMSWWWHNSLMAIDGLDPVRAYSRPRTRLLIEKQLKAALMLEIRGAQSGLERPQDTRHWIISPELAWAARVFYVVQHSNRAGNPDCDENDIEAIAAYFLGLLGRIAERQAQLGSHSDPERRRDPPDKAWVHSVSRNRTIKTAMYKSRSTIKADAAIQTFQVRGKNICWAVIDTGIDARHPAFRRLRDGKPLETAFGSKGENNTRIKATYDFSDIRRHLSQDQRVRMKFSSRRLIDWEELAWKLEREKNVQLRIEHTESSYRTPHQPHGTHVAGILAADWRPEPEAVDPLGPPPPRNNAITYALTGICPEIELYDLRVFRDDGTGDEFAVMSALQFVRSLNQSHDRLEVHGVNLSLAMKHEVSNYACGRSPVCEESTRLVGTGVVVVAAAGNDGRSVFTTVQQKRDEGYRVVSIADPGNAEAVITVGATHRFEPHTYGVSYFSSRGPTGDGRLKPDLVAPGEKIVSTVPGEGQEALAGTSQAAPHVSGAAALLMCRHTDLVGQPERIKQILMETATDLGREKQFQGAGLVDVMRAMQSL